MKLTFSFILIFSFFYTALAQGTDEQISQAQSRIDGLQKTFASEIAPIKMDKGVKNLLTLFVTKRTDSIQQVIQGETDSPEEERLLALNSHAYFLDAFRYEITHNSFEEYHIRDLQGKYLLIWDQTRHHQNSDSIMNLLGPNRCRLIASSFKAYPEGKRFRDIAIIRTAQNSPEKIPGWLSSNPDFIFSDSLIFIWGNRSPASLVRYAKQPPNAGIAEKINNHPSPLVQTLAKMSTEQRVNNYLPFAEQIMNGQLTYGAIDSARADPKKYFQLMVDAMMIKLEEISKGGKPLYIIPLRAYLKEYSVKFYVNVMNGRHEDANEKVRYAELNQLRTQDIYAVIIFGEDNFFTSSYLYTYKKLMEPFQKTGHDSLFRYMYYAGYRQFIRMSGRYNTLNAFLSNMPKDTMTAIISRLVYGLEINTDNGLEESMTVAETFPSFIKETDLSDFMQEQITYNYNRCKSASNFYGQKLYTLLHDIFDAVKAEGKNGDGVIPGRLAEYLTLEHKTLRESSGQITEQVYFYGDDDGKSSYQSFLTNFRDTSTWKTEKTNNWISFQSKKGFPVSVYANLPLENLEDLDRAAQDTLNQYLESQQIIPHIIIHRGHSYHLANTISHTRPETKLAILGSCGGYAEIFSVQQKSENSQVISTKQVGSKSVNEPLLSMIHKQLLEEKDIKWQELWDNLDKQLQKDKKAYAYFVDYIPPHKNIGLLVSKLYHDDGDL